MGEMTLCAECGMPCEAGEYHPYAACLMFKGCHNSATVRANLTQPAQAVDVEHEMVMAFRAGAKWADEHVAPDGRLIGKLPEPRALTVARASNEYAGERTAALPNANGKEG